MGLKIYQISDSFYRFQEYGGEDPNNSHSVDAYLFIGKERAALIDTLQDTKELYTEVRKLTALPVDVLITHGHGDHVGVSTPDFVEAGCPVYMADVDYEGLTAMSGFAKREWFTDLVDGQVFDLGGRRIETIRCGGHTPGSVVFLEREEQIMFTGDTIGSGNFWMQLPGCLPLGEFRKNVEGLYEKVKELKELIVYPGHQYQAPRQLTLSYVEDVCSLTADLVDGKAAGEPREFDFMGAHMKYMEASRGDMRGFCYDPEKI